MTNAQNILKHVVKQDQLIGKEMEDHQEKGGWPAFLPLCRHSSESDVVGQWVEKGDLGRLSELLPCPGLVNEDSQTTEVVGRCRQDGGPGWGGD